MGQKALTDFGFAQFDIHLAVYEPVDGISALERCKRCVSTQCRHMASSAVAANRAVCPPCPAQGTIRAKENLDETTDAVRVDFKDDARKWERGEEPTGAELVLDFLDEAL